MYFPLTGTMETLHKTNAVVLFHILLCTRFTNTLHLQLADE